LLSNTAQSNVPPTMTLDSNHKSMNEIALASP
jgi:hypothetical protein